MISERIWPHCTVSPTLPQPIHYGWCSFSEKLSANIINLVNSSAATLGLMGHDALFSAVAVAELRVMWVLARRDYTEALHKRATKARKIRNMGKLAMHVSDRQSLLICTLILRNQGLFQTLEIFQVLQTLIFFQGSTLKKAGLVL